MLKADVKPQQVPSMDKSHADCPIFLRKTYHMIDTCDPSVAGWSEDGETFVVKNTTIFETRVIPQFFKHSKFSSFVRQLNFYGFKKIKYAESIKIDAKLEAETANYWRFRHDSFRKGKPELLVNIKRSNGSSTLPVKKEKTDESLKLEVSTLQKRIEAMTKNIDDLTAMVQKVTLKQEEQDQKEEAPVGTKRKKVDLVKFDDVRPDEATSMDLDQDFEVPPVATLRRQGSDTSSKVSDDDFVNQLFTTFADGEEEGLLEELPPLSEPSPKDNAPDPAMMKRLSDALTILPREMQEMLVEKLIAAITNTESLEANVSAVAPKPEEPEVSLPLAAATLAAFLAQYGSTVKDKTVLRKSLPVVPIHA